MKHYMIEETNPLNELASKYKYLEETDHKVLLRYMPKEDEDIESIYKLRDEAREFIRANK